MRIENRSLCGALLVGCLAFCMGGCGSRGSPAMAAGYAVIGEHAEEMQRTHGLRLNAIGGSFPTHIPQIGIQYSRQGTVSLEEARSLLLKAADSLLRNLRESREMRIYRCHDPYDYRDITVSICFYKHKKEFSKEGIAKVALENGEITYWRFQEGLKVIHREKYPQA